MEKMVNHKTDDSASVDNLILADLRITKKNNLCIFFRSVVYKRSLRLVKYPRPRMFMVPVFTQITALNAMQTRSSDENSVCPSVRPSVCHTRAL